jgi:predicted nucleic acid-binding protein
MIVVDSSIWIEQIRRPGSRMAQRLKAIDNPEDIIIGDLILLEVLQGARDDQHAARIERELRRFAIEPVLNEQIAIRSAQNYRKLRDRGVTVRKTVDLIIATFCVERDHSLLHDDRDFDLMAPHIGLMVL